MDVKLENAESCAFLDTVYITERPKKLWEFAKAKGIEKHTVYCPDGSTHAATAYLMQMYCWCCTIGDPDNQQTETYQIPSLLLAIQETVYRDSVWSWGSQLLHDLKRTGIRLSRNEIGAFLAQEGTWESNRAKTDLMALTWENGVGVKTGNMLAVSLYCGRLYALIHSLPKAARVFANAEDGEKVSLPQRTGNDQADIENLAISFIPAVTGDPKQVERMLLYMREYSDFYTAPASTKYHGSEPGFLAKHSLNVIYRLEQLLRPVTALQLGEIVMCGLCHDLCKDNVYKPIYKNTKHYCENGSKEDPGGRFDWITEQGYIFEDTLPFGHGRKSLYIAEGFFGANMPESVASAIDAHMNNVAENPMVELQMYQQPLGLFLHLADMLASQIDEAK